MKGRLILALALFALWGGAIVLRLAQLQVRDHEHFRQRAATQQHRRVKLEAPRGTVFDRRGRKLAMSVQVDSAFAVPDDVENVEETARRIGRVLGVPSRRLAATLASEREFVWVARQLDPPVAEALRELELPGIAFLKESKRVYPLRQIASQLLGFAGIDHNGLEGLEQAWDRVVAGEPVERRVMTDARHGTVLSPAGSLREARPGHDVHLTIDASVQHILERELAKALDERRAERATGIVLDPASGAILAMASLPSFDPNQFVDYSANERRNRAIADVFEPGSTFKVVTAAAALETNRLDPADVIDCQMGAITLGRTRINDHHPFGALTFGEVIAKSSNVGAIKAGLLVGGEALYRQIRLFGFGEPTGVDLPGEAVGILRPWEAWQQLDPAYISFGQGISVTALQMVNALAAVANGGTLYRPYVVSGISRPGGFEAVRPQPAVLERPISPATARTLVRMLEAVVTDGTGRKAAIPGYPVAGKTGTAQKPVPGGYSPDQYLSSFVGFAPSRRPAVAAIIAIDEPRVGYHGGDVAAPVFAAVIGPTLLYLGVEPEREPLERWPGEAVLAAAAASPAASPAVPAVAASGSLPDLSGLTARQAVTRAAEMGLEVALHGQGFVQRQAPAAGTARSSVAGRVEVWLAAGRMR